MCVCVCVCVCVYRGGIVQGTLLLAQQSGKKQFGSQAPKSHTSVKVGVVKECPPPQSSHMLPFVLLGY